MFVENDLYFDLEGHLREIEIKIDCFVWAWSGVPGNSNIFPLLWGKHKLIDWLMFKLD